MDLARRIESMMDAWFNSSEITTSSGPNSVALSPSFAFQLAGLDDLRDGRETQVVVAGEYDDLAASLHANA
jgi:hypothetical protein